MSFIYSYLTAQCSLDELQAAVLAAWPSLEVVDAAQQFDSWDSAYKWAEPRSGFLRGKHPHDVKLLFRDGSWSGLADFSLCMSTDEESLAELSRRVGRVVVTTTQGTAGFAQLLVIDAGATTRSITGEDGRTSQSGTPLPEEAGIPLEHFYIDELDSIRQRFGLSSFLDEPAGAVTALHVIDRTSADDVENAPPPRSAQTTRRPWWKFW